VCFLTSEQQKKFDVMNAEMEKLFQKHVPARGEKPGEA